MATSATSTSAPALVPRPERIASSLITTEWTRTHCGANCDVWGVADEGWMECGEESYLMHLVNTTPEEG